MAVIPVSLVATEGVFKGLAKQNLLFHQCIEELCDNAIAASESIDKKAIIDIALIQSTTNSDDVELYVI